MRTDLLRDQSDPFVRRFYRLNELIDPTRVAQLRRMPLAQKIQDLCALYYAGRQEITALIQREHPEWSEEQIKQEVTRVYAAAEG